MANFTYTLTFQDEDGDVSTTSGSLVRADLAAADAAVQAIAEAAQVLSGASIVGAGVKFDLDTSGWSLDLSADVGSDVEIGGRFIFRTAGSFLSNLTIPGFLKDTYATVGGAIDSAATDVLAFISAIVTGGGSTSHYEDLVSYTDGYEVFNGKR